MLSSGMEHFKPGMRVLDKKFNRTGTITSVWSRALQVEMEYPTGPGIAQFSIESAMDELEILVDNRNERM